jgi:hypothetical protein
MSDEALGKLIFYVTHPSEMEGKITTPEVGVGRGQFADKIFTHHFRHFPSISPGK